MLRTEEWFEQWFDSPYYQLLYRHRNEEEACRFIDRLVTALGLRRDEKILDLACGRGRHAVYLNRLGFDVTGLDLSPRNIGLARTFENERLRFHVHDMRQPWPQERFDLVLNLFTSFGYFRDHTENEATIRVIARSLAPGGRLLLDFLNPHLALDRLVPEEVLPIDGIRFEIRRYLDPDGFIVKDIHFRADDRLHHFQERVMAIGRDEFEAYFAAAGLEVAEIYGNYLLEPFDPGRSERMIFLANNN
jgi:SAM-dependent methyltransferase